MRRRAGLALAVTLSIAGASVGAGTAATAAAGGSPRCPLGAIDKAGDQPVEIVFWHAANRTSEDTLVQLTDAFNSSQDDVEVRLVNQTTYRDTIDKYRAGLSSGDLPDLVMIAETGLQQMIDSRSVLPAQACVKADEFDLSDHLERVTDYYTVEGTLWPMPFNVANPLLYYDKALFRRAGLDPEQPPTTLAEVRRYSQQLKDSGVVSNAGFGLKLDAWYFEQWIAKAGKAYVNHANGRKQRASSATFANAAGLEVFTWISGMVEDGLAITNNAEGPGSTDNLVGIATGSHGMSIDSSSALGTALQVLETQYPDVEIGVAPMPGVPGNGGTVVGGAALYIVNKSSPAEQEAAWRFAKYLNQPEQVAIWAAGTGYLPTRAAALEEPVLQQRWTEVPELRVAYDQLTTGPNNVATSGAVIGDYDGVRDAVRNAEVFLTSEGPTPKAALRRAKREADARIRDYNERVGA